MQFIDCRNETDDYGDLAAALVTRALELGIHPREILALPTGFSIPDELAIEFVEPKTPPTWWNDPLDTVDVEFNEDGTVTLTPEAQAAVEVAAVVPTDAEEASAPQRAQSQRPAPPAGARRSRGGQSKV